MPKGINLKESFNLAQHFKGVGVCWVGSFYSVSIVKPNNRKETGGMPKLLRLFTKEWEKEEERAWGPLKGHASDTQIIPSRS